MPPVYRRSAGGSKLDPFKPEIHRLLRQDPRLPGVRVRELLEPLSCTAGKALDAPQVLGELRAEKDVVGVRATRRLLRFLTLAPLLLTALLFARLRLSVRARRRRGDIGRGNGRVPGSALALWPARAPL
jgi:hypothetical protein